MMEQSGLNNIKFSENSPFGLLLVKKLVLLLKQNDPQLSFYINKSFNHTI